MLRNLSGDEQPAILVLDYEMSLSYRELHRQVREFLRLHRNVSLRMCPFRPWYLYSFPVPEQHAVPATDVQCKHLSGTTLVYYVYP